MADEVWFLQNGQGPGGKLFLEFGKQVPAAEWHTDGTGTKQGVYALTADGSYLGAKFVGTNKDDVLKLLRGALEKWNGIVREKNLKPKPIPQRDSKVAFPPRDPAKVTNGMPTDPWLLLQVNQRDLPRPGEGATPVHFEAKFAREWWKNWTQWAWNQNWAALTKDEALALVPRNGPKVEVPEKVVHKLTREYLVDNVRGQRPGWSQKGIQKALLSSEVLKSSGDLATLRLEGAFKAEEDGAGYDCKLYGQAVFSLSQQKFVRFELVATGMRWGTGTFNFRKDDAAPAPMGVSFIIENQYDKPLPALKAATAPAKPEEKSAPVFKAAPAGVQAAWDQALLERMRKGLAAGKKPAFEVSALKETFTVVSESGGTLQLARNGTQLSFAWSRLKPQDRKGLAVVLAGKEDPDDCALAAFHSLAAGDVAQAEEYLSGAGKKGAEVRAAFK